MDIKRVYEEEYHDLQCLLIPAYAAQDGSAEALLQVCLGAMVPWDISYLSLLSFYIMIHVQSALQSAGLDITQVRVRSLTAALRPLLSAPPGLPMSAPAPAPAPMEGQRLVSSSPVQGPSPQPGVNLPTERPEMSPGTLPILPLPAEQPTATVEKPLPPANDTSLQQPIESEFWPHLDSCLSTFQLEGCRSSADQRSSLYSETTRCLRTLSNKLMV